MAFWIVICNSYEVLLVWILYFHVCSTLLYSRVSCNLIELTLQRRRS